MLLREKLSAYAKLTRFDRPIGSYLLLWPTLWALLIAADGLPPISLIIIFTLGVFLTRSAGCAINDFADRKVDGDVKRTAQRPIPTGLVTPKEAVGVFAILMLLAFVMVLFTNMMTILMSFGALALAALYPFMKRYTHFPQVVLGAAFSWGIPMTFTATSETLPWYAWCLFFSNLAWTVGYDTFYAMVDRDDDLKIGVKSTAIAFGRWDLTAIALCFALSAALLISVALTLNFLWTFYVGLGVALCLWIKQFYRTRHRSRDACFWAFLNNHYVGMALFLGIAGHYVLTP
ncbi:MAG: 4-hydroxybenzoate octaprenyltransferase [Pontibacterium sp.]